MIKLTRLDGSDIFLNPDQIEAIEETADTHVTLMNGNRFLVRERAATIVDRIVALKARIIRRADSRRKEKYLRRRLVESYHSSGQASVHRDGE